MGESPTRQTLQPEATGAVMEATKWLKPSVSVSRIGDGASVQAVTRVNAEQASKPSSGRRRHDGRAGGTARRPRVHPRGFLVRHHGGHFPCRPMVWKAGGLSRKPAPRASHCDTLQERSRSCAPADQDRLRLEGGPRRVRSSATRNTYRAKLCCPSGVHCTRPFLRRPQLSQAQEASSGTSQR